MPATTPTPIKPSGLFTTEVMLSSRFQASYQKIFGTTNKTSLYRWANLVPEPTNKFDKMAIALKVEDHQIGYLPKAVSAKLHSQLKRGVQQIRNLKCHVHLAFYDTHRYGAHYRAAADIPSKRERTITRAFHEGDFPRSFEFTIEKRSDENAAVNDFFAEAEDPATLDSTVKFFPNWASKGIMNCAAEMWVVYGCAPNDASFLISLFQDQYWPAIGSIKNRQGNHITIEVQLPDLNAARKEYGLLNREIGHYDSFVQQIQKAYRPRKPYIEKLVAGTHEIGEIVFERNDEISLLSLPSTEELVEHFSPYKDNPAELRWSEPAADWNFNHCISLRSTHRRLKTIKSEWRHGRTGKYFDMHLTMGNCRKLRRYLNAASPPIVCKVVAAKPSQAKLANPGKVVVTDHVESSEVEITVEEAIARKLPIEQELRVEFPPLG